MRCELHSTLERTIVLYPFMKLFFLFTPKICFSLLAFHAFTGCDTVSSFGGRGKKQPGKHGKYFLRSVMHS